MLRVASAMIALMLIASACGGTGSDDGADPGDGPGVTQPGDTQSAGTESDETQSDGPESDGGESGEAESAETGGLVSTAIADLPQAPSDGTFQIMVVDFTATVGLLGLELASLENRLAGLGRWGPANDGGLGFRLAIPESLQVPFSRPDEFAEETGFALSDIDIASQAVVEGGSVSVFVGPDAWGGPSEPHSFGMLTLGQGEDCEFNLDNRTTLDPLGRPVRLAQLGDRLAAACSTELLQGWLDGPGARYSTDHRLFEIAAELDQHDVVSAHLFVEDFNATGPFASEELEEQVAGAAYISEHFVAVGIGNTVRDGRAIEVISYHFGSEAGAEAALPSIENAWTNVQLLWTDRPVSDFAEFESMERNGAVVTVVVVVPDDEIGRAFDMLVSRDLPMAHLS